MKSIPAYATPQTVSGHKVYPCAYGHIHWLTERKNPVMTQKGNVNDYALAEICFAFTSDPKSLQGIKGAAAKARVTTFLMESTSKLPSGIVDARKQGDRELLCQHDSPKKSPGAGSQKPQACDPCAEAVIIYTLGKCNLTREQILYELPAEFVNQLMSCAWIEAGREIESIEQRGKAKSEILDKLAAIAKRPKLKFNF
jgi:hypothetical protein